MGIGGFNSGAWLGEIATIGFSGTARDTGSFTSGAINVSLPTFDAVATGTTGSSSHMTWAYGSEGVGSWTNANQNTIGEAMWTLLNAIKGFQSTTFTWKEVRLSAITSAGAVVNGASVGTITSPLAGAAAQAAPPQQAVVSSLVTGGRGPRNRGRLYIPATVLSLGTDALVGPSTATTVNNASKAFINACNAISGIRCAVVSGTYGTYSDITSVRIGDEVDTQRRRRMRRKEVYTTLAV